VWSLMTAFFKECGTKNKKEYSYENYRSKTGNFIGSLTGTI
jgi:hypothetical protein